MKTLLQSALVAYLLTAVVLAWGDSVTLSASADTSLFAAFPDSNLGASTSLVCGANGSGYPSRELIRFDLAGQIPSNAIIQSIELKMIVITAPMGGGTPSYFDLRPLFVDWTEGTGVSNSGSSANSGEPTWNNHFAPSTPWAAPGGGISNDFSGVVSASVLFTNVGAYTFASNSNLVADVQQWLAHPATNFGWILISEAEDTLFTARRFGSRENTGNEPSLTVQFTVPSTPVVLTIGKTNDMTALSFTAQAGGSYTIQYESSVDPDGWQTLTNIPPQLISTNLVVVDPATNESQRFYRVVSPN